jgi:chemosensory pili system protein ChpA (sensor histidine kinase/response regulator)
VLRIRADLIDRLVGEAGEMAISRSRISGSLKSVKTSLHDLTSDVTRLRNQLREFEIHAEASMQSQLGSIAGVDGQPRDFDPLELDRFTRLQELTRMMVESVGDIAAVQHGLLRQMDIAGEALAVQTRQNSDLSHALLRARMLPFSTVAERLHRVVRLTAKELGRQANLDIRGGDTPVDRTVLERMVAPLEHLLRNAVAHGIEDPDARRTVGKEELGQLTLSIATTDNDIALTLADDGRGLDFDAIRRRGVERGLLEEEARPDDAALVELIFQPGLSTAAALDATAGRGIGLDVVRAEVNQLGGRIEVRTQPGKGAQFRIDLPISLAVIPVMLATAAGQRWAIPTAMVEEARELDAEEAAVCRAAGSIVREGHAYPWHSLPELFGMAEPPGPPAWQLMLHSGGERIALEAEALTQHLEVVVKPVSDQLARVPGLAGATVLPDGAVALIVNPIALTGRSVTSSFGAVPPAPTFVAPLVMVVDDSLTVRKITGRLLERAGYRVTTAKDGMDALEQIERERPAVILADIEMPRMDGFELVRALRAAPALARLPVVMITSRIAERHRQVARDLGVRHYLGKPYDEDALLALVADLIKAA